MVTKMETEYTSDPGGVAAASRYGVLPLAACLHVIENKKEMLI